MTLSKLGTATALAVLFLSTSSFANMKDHFKMMDSDGDGRITSAEHDAASNQKFSKADMNHDNMLTKDEMSGMMREHKGKSAMKGEMKGHKKSGMKMDMWDSNKDGQVTMQEYQSGHKDHFSKMDSNSDGVLTMDEMKKDKEQW